MRQIFLQSPFGYSSVISQTQSEASVPPTVTKVLIPYKNRAQAIGPVYTLASANSARGVIHGYLKSLK